jgi:hypothetical protein
MTIELVMQYNDAYAEIGNLSASRAAEYADRHGYKLHVFRDLPMPEEPFWSKVKRLRLMSKEPSAFERYLFWMDADTLILDLDFKLEDLMKGEAMDISSDCGGICTGVFGIHTNVKGRVLLGTWLFLGQVEDDTKFGVGGLHEQATLMLLDKEFPAIHGLIHRIPQSVISNPITKPDECPGKAFMHHFWTRLRSPAEVLKEMQQVMNDLYPVKF